MMSLLVCDVCGLPDSWDGGGRVLGVKEVLENGNLSRYNISSSMVAGQDARKGNPSKKFPLEVSGRGTRSLEYCIISHLLLVVYYPTVAGLLIFPNFQQGLLCVLAHYQ